MTSIIDARNQNLSQLLANQRYAVDYYQREYRWQTKNIQELLEDLTSRFQDTYSPGDSTAAVQQYRPYFLGSIVLAERDGQRYIVDGQQRLTSLTLLLTYLRHVQKQHGLDMDDPSLASLIYANHFGVKAFNLNVPERNDVMQALYGGQAYDTAETSESVRNIHGRYQDIEKLFPGVFPDAAALPHFLYWLISKVILVEIKTDSDDEAYSIFETMNDRGLSLTPSEMLKGYLLANLRDPEKRKQEGARWRERVDELREFGKETEAEFIKAWLRAKYAQDIRERKKNSDPLDFDLIGTSFHKWVRDHRELIGLNEDKPETFEAFLRQFHFFARQYVRVLRAGQQLTSGLESVYFNARNEFTLQTTVLLAPLEAGDDEATVLAKLRLTADYLDSYIMRRAVNYKTLTYSSVVYAMFTTVKAIRGKSVPELTEVLRKRLNEMEETLDGILSLDLNQFTKRYVHHLLARLAYHIERSVGEPTNVSAYLNHYEVLDAKFKPFEIEHVIPNKFEDHAQDFVSEQDFQQARQRLGNLILLQRGPNQSIGAGKYDQKLPAYRSGNVLARSLCPDTYVSHPALKGFALSTGGFLEGYASFGPHAILRRQALYRALAEHIWGTERLIAP